MPNAGRFRLPSVEIAPWQRDAEALTLAMKEKWGCVVICLFELEGFRGKSNCHVHRYVAMESRDDLDPSNGEPVWASVATLPPTSLQAEDSAALTQFFDDCRTHGKDPSSAFAEPGWFQELEAWITDVLQKIDLQLRGSFRQFSAGPSSSLIRFETNGPAVWFKAVDDQHGQEFAITVKLAELFPAFLTKVIGIRPDWNGWLSLEVEGMSLSQTRDTALWEKAASSLARLQIESLGKTTDVVSSGACAVSTETLAGSARPFFSRVAELMMRQTKVPPPVLTEQEIFDLERRIQDWLDRLAYLDIPDALGHLDLNPGNIIISREGCVFLDWAEACVGNPFFTFQYLLEYFRRAVTTDSAAGSRLTAAYLRAWEPLLSAGQFGEGLQLSPALAVFAFAVGAIDWKDPERLKDTSFAGYLRSLARRMHREANALDARSSLCLC